MPLRPGFLAELEQLAVTGGRFFVELGKSPAGPQPREFGSICRGVIAPLLEGASECWLFDQPANALLERFRPHLTPWRRRFAVKLDRDVVTGFEAFWGADCWERGSIAWKTAFASDAVGRVFARTSDPGFLTNLRTVAGAAAMNYARSAIAADPDAVVYLLSANRGLGELHVFAHDHLLPLLRLAFERSRLSESYLLRYGDPAC